MTYWLQPATRRRSSWFGFTFRELANIRNMNCNRHFFCAFCCFSGARLINIIISCRWPRSSQDLQIKTPSNKQVVAQCCPVWRQRRRSAVLELTWRGQCQSRHAVVSERTVLELQALFTDLHLHTALATNKQDAWILARLLTRCCPIKESPKIYFSP